jgi:hypothetical protein
MFKRNDPENRDRSQEGEMRKITKQSWRRFLFSLIPFLILYHYSSSKRFEEIILVEIRGTNWVSILPCS